eukprot:584935-Amorphochlora_amoeboformis.AAC.1
MSQKITLISLSLRCPKVSGERLAVVSQLSSPGTAPRLVIRSPSEKKAPPQAHKGGLGVQG